MQLPITQQDEAMLQWLHTGIAAGWCSDTYCIIHDLSPLNDHERAALDAGIDNCISGVRIYTNLLPFYPATDTTEEH